MSHYVLALAHKFTFTSITFASHNTELRCRMRTPARHTMTSGGSHDFFWPPFIWVRVFSYSIRIKHRDLEILLQQHLERSRSWQSLLHGHRLSERLGITQYHYLTQ